MAVEHKLGLDHPLVHRRGRLLWPRAKNSVNACATRAEIVLPDSLARSRTRATSTAGSLTVNTVDSSGTATGPTAAARSAYRRACRTEQSNRSAKDRKSTRLNSSHLGISYAVFCLKKKTITVVSSPQRKPRNKSNVRCTSIGFFLPTAL